MSACHPWYLSIALSLILLLGSAGAGVQEVGNGTPRQVTAAEQRAVVERMIEVLVDRYVFPETASLIAASLRSDLAAGEYGRPLTPDSFANHPSGRIRSLAGDGHLWVMPHAEPEGGAPDGAAVAEEPVDRRVAWPARTSAFPEQRCSPAMSATWTSDSSSTPRSAAMPSPRPSPPSATWMA